MARFLHRAIIMYMNKKVLTYIIIGCVSVIAFFLYSRDTDITNHPSSGSSIVAFGDSLVQGIGASSGNDFPSILSRMIGEPVINKGVSGNTTVDALARIKSVTILKPRVVIIVLGGNDVLQRIPPEETFQNLAKIIDEIHRSGAVVLLVGVKGGVVGDPYANRYKDLAREKGTLYVSNILEELLGDPSVMTDGIHPNDAGYQIVSEKIFKQLQKVL